MSDSSEDEDLSRFKDVVDTTFVKLIDESRGKKLDAEIVKPRSERYLDAPTHYNDVKVSEEMQRRIGAKVSAVINKTIEFVEIKKKKLITEPEIKGGVKLFRDSKQFIKCDVMTDKDIITDIHNKFSKKVKNSSKRRQIDLDVMEPDEQDKLNSVVVSGDIVLLKKDKCWRPKRKQKVDEFVAVGNNKFNLSIGVRKPNTS